MFWWAQPRLRKPREDDHVLHAVVGFIFAALVVTIVVVLV